MVEGLEVVIKYRGVKHDQVASPATASSEFAILKKDLAHLRVHSPSHKNVRRVNGSFVLHWPTAGTASHKVETLFSDTLHKRWFKLCSDDPEALKLREFLSIESITLTQDGVLICSSLRPGQASQDVPTGSLAERLSDPQSKETAHPLATAPVPMNPMNSASIASPVEPHQPPPAKIPPTAPRSDRQPPPHLKRRKSSDTEDLPIAQRQKLDVQPQEGQGQGQTMENAVHADVHAQLPPQAPASPKVNLQQHEGRSSIPEDATTVPNPPFARDDPTDAVPVASKPTEPEIKDLSLPRESGGMSPHAAVPVPVPVPIPVPVPVHKPSSPLPRPSSSLGSTSRPPPPGPRPASPYMNASSFSPANGDHGPRRRDRDVSRLTRELWDTRRQLTAMQAREQVILDDLERLGARPEGGNGGGSERHGVSKQELLGLEADLRVERTRRARAERALSDVERECRAPFVVPALFQAFMSISELSNH